MDNTADRIRAVESRLLPIVRLEGADDRLTLDELMTRNRIPAVSVAVMEQGEIAWARAWGVLEAGGCSPANTDTLFQAASMSKMVTAFLVMQLVDAGTVDLDGDVNQWLETWQVPENELTRRQPVTLRQVLGHKAGLTVHGFGRSPSDGIPTILDILNGRPPAANVPVRVEALPGTREQYSGGGTTLCQLLLEELTGMGFAELAQQRVLRPLGMQRSTFAEPLPEQWWPNAARGHRFDGTVPERWWYGCPAAAAGGLWTTPSDFARFFLEIRRAWLGQSELLGQAAAREMLAAPEIGFFALGPRIKGRGTATWFNHGGFHEDFKSEAVCYPASGDGAVVMVNGGLTEAPCWEILNGIAAAYGWPGFIPAARVAVELPLEQLQRYVGQYHIDYGYEPGDRIEVWLEGGILMGQLQPLPATRIYFESAAELFNLARPDTLRVGFDETGLARTLTVIEDGKAIIGASRIDDGASRPTAQPRPVQA